MRRSADGARAFSPFWDPDRDRVNVVGVGVSPVDLDRALATVGGWVESSESAYVCVTGVHGVMESRRDPVLRDIHNRAGMVVPDGMPLVWLSRLAGVDRPGRVYGPDLMLAVCEASVERGWSHYLYGGAEGVPETLIRRLESRFPGIRIAGSWSPPFRPLTAEEDRLAVQRIRDSGADLVWVGLGTPKQERWMADHVDRLQAVILGVGAAFDFHAGLKPQAPAWMQRSGLEWLFRLATEPRRLWRRYCVNNPWFIAEIALQATGLRRHRIDPSSPEGAAVPAAS